MKKRRTSKIEIIASLIKKFYLNKDIDNLIKLIKKTKFDLINDSLSYIDDPAIVLFLLMAVNKNKTSTIYRYLPNELQDKIIEIATNNQIKIIFHQLYPDEILDIANRNSNNFKKIIINLSAEQRNLIKEIDSFKEDEAGAFMNPEFISFNNDWTIKKCLEVFRKNFKEVEQNLIIYITSSRGLLLGQVKLQDLFFVDNYSKKINSIMDESFISVKPNEDIESIINLFKEYHFENIPVVNDESRLIGIISDNDILPAIDEEITEDIYNMYGIKKIEESYFKSSILRIVKSRLLWVIILMISATLTSIAISLFQNLGANLTAGVSTALLVPIIPVITGTSGNTGSQSFATTVRLIAIGDVTPKEYRKLILKEFKIGLVLGLFLSIVNFIRLLIYFAIPAFRQNDMSHTIIPYQETLFISLCASFALWFAVIMSKLLGACLPIIALKLKLDPTIMSGPLISTTLDLASTSLLFGIGIWILQIVAPLFS